MRKRTNKTKNGVLIASAMPKNESPKNTGKRDIKETPKVKSYVNYENINK